MREIKFRVFDKEHKMMCTYYLTHVLFHLYYQDPNNFELMQYTGLKDVNGNDIYEGDLLNVFFTSFNGEYNHDCIYQADINSIYGLTLTYRGLLWECYGYNQHTIATNISAKYNNICEDYRNKKYDRLAVEGLDREDYSNYIEVIGNIYENPELITSPNDS